MIANTQGQGNSGLINIEAQDSITITGESNISSRVRETAIGDAGGIRITANSILFDEGSRLDAGTVGQGNGSDIEISGSLVLVAGSSRIKSETTTQGNAGNILIDKVDTLLIIDGSGFIVRSLADGNAGNVEVIANNLELDGGEIIAENVSGNFGNINLTINEDIILRNNSLISARAFKAGNGGNINIDTNFIVAFPGNNDIIASAEQGEGGNININAESLLGITERPLNDSTNDINASSEFNLDGSVDVNTPDVNPLQGATGLPSNVVVPEETAAQACQADRETAAKNGLDNTGKGGIIPDPALPLNSLNVTVNGETNSTSTIPAPIETSQGKIQPARGVEITKSGEVILTAYRTNNSGGRIPSSSANCDSI